MTDHIRAGTSGGILTLVLDRPEKKNALTDAMYAALADALEHAEADPDARVILIRSEGEMFTAGNDIAEFVTVAMGGGALNNVLRFLRALARATRPIVAAVQGRAVGVGMTMLLHCDQVVLAQDAVLTTPFVNLGLVPEAASSLLLPARIGHARAFAMLALGEPMSAAEALAVGLANRVVPVDALIATAQDLAARIARQPLGAMAATKRLMRDPDAIVRRMDIENAEFSVRLASAEAREAFTAFAERRAPNFTGLN